MRYVGRFAPSPTGPLHLGSLTTAAASYLHARQAGGRWLVRIEDIDPPREVPGASDRILRTLEAFELRWDGPVLYQSRRRELYWAAAQRLLSDGRAFRCSCSRSTLRAAAAEDPRYPGTCRAKPAQDGPTAIRARVEPGLERFTDGLQGEVVTELAATTGDYVIWRRDDLPAYHLAVVIDDALQGVTAIVRGSDLLETTPIHLHLQRALGFSAPRYFHTPVTLNAAGQKLSKQTGAESIESQDPSTVAHRVLALLGATPPNELLGAAPGDLWRWAVEQWRIDGLRGVRAWPPGTVAAESGVPIRPPPGA